MFLWLTRLQINTLVKITRGFWRDKKILKGKKHYITIYEASLALLAFLLINYARQTGEIDKMRMYLIERIHGHFEEHVMLSESSHEEALNRLYQFNHDYDDMGSNLFERETNLFIGDMGPLLPKIVNEQIVTHFAFFLRVDNLAADILEERRIINELYLQLFGRMDEENIEKLMDTASKYEIEYR